jgi:hypothetical protein
MPGFWELNEVVSQAAVQDHGWRELAYERPQHEPTRGTRETGSAMTTLPKPSRWTNSIGCSRRHAFAVKIQETGARVAQGYRADTPLRIPSPPNLSIAETVDEVIVHHADPLHVRINDGRTNEAESPLLEILAKRVRFR